MSNYHWLSERCAIMQLMVGHDRKLIVALTTLQTRTAVRYATYARRYESFRRLPVCSSESDRTLQLNIAYLYHTSLSILEERQQSLNEYMSDVKDVVDSFVEMEDTEKMNEIRSNLVVECAEEVNLLEQELRQIDKGIEQAYKHEQELMVD